MTIQTEMGKEIYFFILLLLLYLLTTTTATQCHKQGTNTELYFSWNRNTAVLLYGLLSGHGEQKWLAHMINQSLV